MSDKLKPYPKYKDSGVPWLGQIPEHWDVRRNGRLFAQRNETGFGELPILEVSLRTGVRVRDMDNQKRKQVMSDAEKYKRAAKGDIAYNMMRMWQGALGTAPVDGLVSPAYVVARPFEETNPNYYSYLFRTEAYKAEVDGYSRGIVKDRNRLYWNDFKCMPSCFPPPEEQAAIVRFLDANAVLVRQFIRNRRRLIYALTEQKQAIINRAVTHGLNPNVRMKPSGVDWLQDIPEHWEIVRNGRLFAQRNETDFAELPILEVSLNTGVSVRDMSNTKRKQVMSDREKYKKADRGDLAYNMMRLWQGAVGTVPVNGLVSPAYVVARPFKNTNTKFYAFLFRTNDYMAEIDGYSRGIVKDRNRLYWEDFKRMTSVFPPRCEQDQIAEMIEQFESDFRIAIGTIDREIALMMEYRDRLIACVSAGALDVRFLNFDAGDLLDTTEEDFETDSADEEEFDEELTHADD